MAGADVQTPWLREARRLLRARSPFLDLTLQQTDVRAVCGIGTAQVRFHGAGAIIEYDPDYLQGLSPDEVRAVLEHEIWHVLNRHRERRGDRDASRWNLAADYAINSYVTGLPAGTAEPPPHLRGKAAEEIYERLGDAGRLPESAGCFEVLGEPVGGYGRASQRWFLNWGGPNRRAASLVAALARLSAAHAADAGVLTPGGALTVNWAAIVGRYARRRERRRTLLRPDRRGLSIWGKRRRRRPKVVVALDTSGSISPEQGQAFVGALHRLRAHCDRLTVILADASVRSVVPFERLAATPFLGRGSTDFGPAIAHVNAHLTDQDLFVYLTDGHGAVPTVRPAISFVWVVTANAEFAGRPVVFARRP